MGRHRDSGSGIRPPLPADGGTATSHRPPPGLGRARTLSLVAAGALAGGAAIVGTAAPWSQEAAYDRPASPTGGLFRAPDDRFGAPVLSVPAPRAPEPAQPVVAPVASPLTQPPARTVWRGDGPAAFRSTPWTTVGALPPQRDGDEVSFVLTGRGQRSELEPDLPVIREGDEHEVTVSVRLDGDFPTHSPGHQVITRWENDSPGSAPLDLRIQDGHLVLHGGGGHPSGPRTFTRTLGPAPTEDWARLYVRVRFSADPDKAGVSVWRDGRPVVEDDSPPGGTLYPGQESYLKAGLHRDRTIATPSAVQFREWRVDHVHATPTDDDERQAEDVADDASETSSTDSTGSTDSTDSTDGARHEAASDDREEHAPETSDRDEQSDSDEQSDRHASRDQDRDDDRDEASSPESSHESTHEESQESSHEESHQESTDDVASRDTSHDSRSGSDSRSDSGSRSGSRDAHDH